MVASRGTDNLQIHWTLPGGGFQYFEVLISNEELNYSNTSTTTVNTTHIRDLDPGRMFVINVTAVAGGFSNSSEPTSFATSEFPSAPTTHSLNMTFINSNVYHLM